MRRSLLLTRDFPPVPGGISAMFLQLWRHIPSNRMLVLTPSVRGGREADERNGYRPLRFHAPGGGMAGKAAASLIMTFHALWLVLFRGVREIHAGQILSCGPTGLLLQKLFGIPCFLWLFGGETTSAYRRHPIEELLVELLIRQSRYIVTIGPTTTREFTDFGIPRERIVEVMPAVDADVFSPGPRPEELAARHGLAGKRVLLTVARLTPRKGHDLVLRALALMEERTDIRYVVVGSGEDRGRLEQMATELGIRDSVVFMGRADDAELPDYYRLADIYVMPNREVIGSTDSIEGFGISFIEAAATGIPSIAGRSGGAVDAVADGETGLLVDPESPHELADAIRKLLDDTSLRKKMGMRGRERVERQFSWKDRAREFASLITVHPFGPETPGPPS